MEPLNIIKIDTVKSTNDELKKIISTEELPEGSLLWAKNQENGRGMGSNTWESEAGKNLTFSLLLRPSFLEASDMFLISKAISLGIIDYLNSLKDCFTIKWPNDIYYCDKKVGGILIENQIQGSQIKYSIIGIGINVNQKFFTSQAPNPLSLISIFGESLSLEECLNNMTHQIGIWYDLLADGFYEKINQRYFDHLYRNKGYHEFKADNTSFMAKIKSVETDGQMVLKVKQDEIRKFYLKEVEFVI